MIWSIWVLKQYYWETVDSMSDKWDIWWQLSTKIMRNKLSSIPQKQQKMKMKRFAQGCTLLEVA